MVVCSRLELNSLALRPLWMLSCSTELSLTPLPILTGFSDQGPRCDKSKLKFKCYIVTFVLRN